MGIQRRQFNKIFKAKVALEAIRGDGSINELAAKHKVYPTQILLRKKHALENPLTCSWMSPESHASMIGL